MRRLCRSIGSAGTAAGDDGAATAPGFAEQQQARDQEPDADQRRKRLGPHRATVLEHREIGIGIKINRGANDDADAQQHVAHPSPPWLFTTVDTTHSTHFTVVARLDRAIQ